METSDAIIAVASGSPEPPYADINTPDVSVTDVWSESDLQILRNYEKYHLEMVQFFVNLKRDGPGIWDEPKKPKDNYKLLLEKGKGKFKKLVGKDLHNFLKNSCITSSDVKCPKVSEAGPFTSLASMRDYLISGYHGLKKCHSNTLAASIDYGDWLNEALICISMNRAMENKQHRGENISNKTWASEILTPENCGQYRTFWGRIKDSEILVCQYRRYVDTWVLSNVYSQQMSKHRVTGVPAMNGYQRLLLRLRRMRRLPISIEWVSF